ncbi:hypothetical protein [Fructobacillus americanaquae]|uniref:DUF5590 domain-containing protein n=1 Tax=Fructobacillus americanaquae TaxID=2940302 RepID=A0ABY5C1Q7_9LACO|nr:hypothetical protein [Fructobacillus americanaquae]USS92297.1 hypothetical protein M3M36_01390 [Fructobacillus americanaquae]
MEVHDNLRVRMARPKRFSWVKFLIVLVTIFLIVAGAIYAYAYMALQPMAKAESNVQKTVSQKTTLTNLHNVTVDDRNGMVYAVLGQDSAGQQKVALVQGQHGTVTTFDFGNGLSRTDLLKRIKAKYNPKKVYSANLSLYQKTLVWEIIYESQNGDMNYLTMDYKTGTVYRAINGI